MRRLVTGPFAYLLELTRAIRQGWDRFFFSPVDPTPLGLIRLGTGALLFWSLAVAGFDLQAYFGKTGWANTDYVRARLAEQSPTAWSFWFFVPDNALLPVWVGCLVVLAFYTVGLWSRVSAILAWVIAVSTARRTPYLLYGFDQVVAIWALYLAASGASGQAVSLDRWIARFRSSRAEAARLKKDGKFVIPAGVPESSVSANLGIRLIQIHLVLIYGMAGLAKLRGEPWWDGSAGWGLVAAGEFRLFDLTWLASFPLLLQLGTHLGLLMELSYPIAIWIPQIRPLMMALVVLMHLAIGFTLGLVEFSLAMIVGNIAFASGAWLRSLAAGQGSGSYARVLYDGACPRCRASIALFTAGDPARLIEPIDLTAVDVKSINPSLTPEACMRSMHVVRTDGRVFEGFEAVLQVARCAPMFWPLALFGVVPGVTFVGRRIYHRIAASRPRDVVCNDEVCALPTATAPKSSTSRRSTDESERPRSVRH